MSINLKTFLTVTMLFFIACLSGCSHESYRLQSITTSKDITYVGYEDGVNYINPYQFTLGDVKDKNSTGDGADKPSTCPLYEIALKVENDGSTHLNSKQARNLLQLRMITYSDEAAARHLAGILGLEDTINIGTGVTAITLDALAASFTATSTKTALSSFSGAATGVRGLINEELYHNAFGPAIIRAIIEDRRKKAIDMAKKRKEPIDQYHVDLAIQDALNYHERGSFFYGLALLQKETHRVIDEKENKNDIESDEVGLTAKSKSNMTLSELRGNVAQLTGVADQNKIWNEAANSLPPSFKMEYDKAISQGMSEGIAFSVAKNKYAVPGSVDIEEKSTEVADALRNAITANP